MSEGSTTYLQGLITRVNVGDPQAREDLFRHSYDRLLRLTHRMLKDFPGVRLLEETDDVLHNAQVRLLRALEAINPTSVREFFGLASTQIRRELLDLARHHFGPQGSGRRQPPRGPTDGLEDSRSPDDAQADTTHEPQRLASWTEFHEQVEALPPEEREVVELLWYQEVTQAEAAEVLQVAEITVKRRWLSARLRLRERLKGETL